MMNSNVPPRVTATATATYGPAKANSIVHPYTWPSRPAITLNQIRCGNAFAHLCSRREVFNFGLGGSVSSGGASTSGSVATGVVCAAGGRSKS